MTTRDALADEIRGLVETAAEIEIASPAQDLVEQGLLDSFGLVNVLYALESRYGISVTLDDLNLGNFRSVDRIMSFVEGRLS